MKMLFPWEEIRTTQLLDDGFDGKDCVLMQFTGLLDKNGKEIYEGDIVTLSNFLGNRIVEWSNKLGQAGFTLKRIDDDCPAPIRNAGKIIIGNIYMNPELIKASE
jgi:hypothetical protein